MRAYLSEHGIILKTQGTARAEAAMALEVVKAVLCLYGGCAARD
jgi:hypothetical protein